MTGTSPSPSNPHDHSEYISSLNNTPRILRFQARLVDAATNLRSLSQEEDDMFPEPYSPVSASSDSALDKMDHIVDEPLPDNPFLSSSSAIKQAAIKRRRSIKSAKAIAVELDPEESSITTRGISRSRRSSTDSSMASLDEATSFYSYSSFEDKIASAAMSTPTQKRSVRNLNGFGSVSRAKRRKLKGRNVVDPKIWAHSQDSNEASVRVDIDEDRSPTFVLNKPSDNDASKRRPRGNKRDATRVIIGTPLPHRLHTQQRLHKPQDTLDAKLNRLRKHAPATELDLSSHNIVPDSLEEVLQSESLSIWTNSQRSLDSIDGDLVLSNQRRTVSFGDSSFTTTELIPEIEPISVNVENSDLTLSLEETGQNATTVKHPSPGSDALSDINESPHAQIEISSQVDETVEGSSQTPATISSPSLQSTVLSADLPSEDTTEYQQHEVDEETSTENMAKVKDDVSSTSESLAGDNPQHEEDIYPDSDNEPNSSDDQQDEANKQSSYLRQLASSMSRFILG